MIYFSSYVSDSVRFQAWQSKSQITLRGGEEPPVKVSGDVIIRRVGGGWGDFKIHKLFQILPRTPFLSSRFFLPGHKFENICIGRSYWPPGDQNKKHGEAYVTRISHHVGSDYQRESCQFKDEQYSFKELSRAG